MNCDGEVELDEVTADRSLPTDWDSTPVAVIAAGGVRTEIPLLLSERTAASTEGISAEVDTEFNMVLFTAKVNAPAVTTPAIEMVVAREVFIGINI
jgi:hypothetical protein